MKQYEPKKIGIYTLLFPSGKKYIGQTIDFDKRMKGYKRRACYNQRKLYYAIGKYGWDSVIKDFTPCLESMLNMAEKTAIAHHNTVLKGYNLTWGGEGGGSPSDETRLKMRLAQLGKKNPGVAKANSVRVVSEESRQRKRDAMLGKKHNANTKRLIGEANARRIIKDETREKHAEWGRKRVAEKNNWWRGGKDRICFSCNVNKVHITKKGKVAGYCLICLRQKVRENYHKNKNNGRIVKIKDYNVKARETL